MTDPRRHLVTDKIPSLAAWLGDGARADGFEDWVATITALEQVRADDATLSGEPEMIRARARLSRVLAIALVEAGRVETETHGQGHTETLFRAVGVFAGLSVAYVFAMLDADKAPPLPKIAKLISDQFADHARAYARLVRREMAAGK